METVKLTEKQSKRKIGNKCENMPEITEDKKLARVRNRRVHMANERTFLAWIRTGIGIMAFGFVVEKFGLFIRQLSYFLGKSPDLKPLLDRLIRLQDTRRSWGFSL